MDPLRYRSACVGALFVAVALAASGARAAEPEPALAATMSCERASEPGRVRCAVEARAAGGRSISWADVAIVELPEFAAALKGRIGPGDATFRDVATQKWAFGLVARKGGEGEARVRVRAVVCEPSAGDAAAPKCLPATVEVRATIHVG
ncbi:MAG: hypothetical protein KF764_12035 [Labilithrix sp.]|nr:hypothetical protein [Labilithrix sp.]